MTCTLLQISGISNSLPVNCDDQQCTQCELKTPLGVKPHSAETRSMHGSIKCQPILKTNEAEDQPMTSPATKHTSSVANIVSTAKHSDSIGTPSKGSVLEHPSDMSAGNEMKLNEHRGSVEEAREKETSNESTDLMMTMQGNAWYTITVKHFYIYIYIYIYISISTFTYGR